MIRSSCLLCALVAGPLLASAAATPPGISPPAGNAATGAAAAAGAAGGAAGGATPSAPPSRPAWLPTRSVQEEDIETMLNERTLWVEAADSRLLVVHRPPVTGTGAGSLLFLVDETGAPDARSRSALLRRGLARHGWHTFFARLPERPVPSAEDQGSAPRDEAQLEQLRPVLRALLDAVRSAAPGGVTVLAAEGRVGHRVAPLAAQLTLDGLIFLNLPDPRVLPAESHVALANLSLPALLVQESPLGWDSDQGLGPGVEVQRLPPGAAGREDDRVLRRIRGWLQRRLTG